MFINPSRSNGIQLGSDVDTAPCSSREVSIRYSVRRREDGLGFQLGCNGGVCL